MRAQFRRAGVAGGLLAVLVLAGCAAPATEPPRPSASSFVGKTLEYALTTINGSVASLDASKAVGAQPDAESPAASTMTVIAACYESEAQLNVAVIRSEDYDGKVKEKSQAGDYDSLLSDCES